MADRALSSYREARAVEMRVRGADYDTIASELGYHGRSGAWKAVQRALTRTTISNVQRYRMIRFAELEETRRRWEPVADTGDIPAIMRCLAAGTERAQLLDLT